MKTPLTLILLGALALGTNQATAPVRPIIAGIAHVSIQVSDLAKARQFYGGLLGYPEAAPANRPHVAVYAVNARQRLIVRDGLPADRDERFVALAFEVFDLGGMRNYLASQKLAPDDAAPDRDIGGTSLSVNDADGHLLRFVQLDTAPPLRPGSDSRLSTRILHAGLTVKDGAAADVFYKQTLGFSETWRGGRPEGVINWINMRVPEGTDYLEYMLFPTTPPTRRQLGSAHHVALLVPDIQQALETVRARTRPDDPNHRANPSIGTNNRWQLNLFDPDGTRIELMEPWTVR